MEAVKSNPSKSYAFPASYDISEYIMREREKERERESITLKKIK